MVSREQVTVSGSVLTLSQISQIRVTSRTGQQSQSGRMDVPPAEDSQSHQSIYTR